MDILLTHGYYLGEDANELKVMRPYPPLGILYISSHLKRTGFDAQVFDATFSTREVFHDFVRRERPRVVGFYVTMMTRRSVLQEIGFCKDQGCVVILGGPDPANYAEEYLARGANIVVIGEGEQTLEELLPHLDRHGPNNMRHIQGLVYAEDGKHLVRTNPRPYLGNLDGQPFPDRPALDIDRYLRVWQGHHGRSSMSLITARGCPYTCAWCSHAVFGNTHRRRSPENVADEVELIVQTYRPDQLWYADDVFTINAQWTLAYAGELNRRGLRIPFEAISREDRLDEEIIRILAEMGCGRLWIGSESGSQRVLDAMHRRTNVQRVREIVRLLQRHGIEAGLFIMLGYEGESAGDVEATAELLKASTPDVFLTTIAYPVKGTRYYEQVADRVLPLKSWHEGSDRDQTVIGRHSRRYYSFANRWLTSEVAWRRQLNSDHRDYRQMARSYASGQLSRWGMLLTEREVERG